MTRAPAANGQLALLLEVAGTPKPGNVDRHRDHAALRFEHFLAGAIGAREGLSMAARGAAVGDAFERAVHGMSQQEGGNTQFGCLLLLVPLIRSAGVADLSREGIRRICEDTTVADSRGFYRAFEHVDVAVADPPEGMDELDVRRGTDAIPALIERRVTLYDVMQASADRDGNAREWVDGFPRTFREAELILEDDGPVGNRVSRAFLRLLAEREDDFVRMTVGQEVATEVYERANAAVVGDENPETLAEEFVERGINPGTTADVTCAALFVALERGLSV